MNEVLKRLLGLAAVGVVCVMMAVPGVSWGQGEDEEEESLAQAMMEESRAKQYAPRMYMVAVLCRLTDEQYEAARTLQESFVQRMSRANLKLQEYMKFLEQEHGSGAMTEEARREKVTSVYRDIREYDTRLSDELKTDLKDLLTDEQLAEWEWVEKLWRVHEDEGTLYGYGSGGQYLLRTVSTKLMDTEVSPEIRAVLENYLTELDRVLDQNNADVTKHFEERNRIHSDATLSEEEKREAIRQLGRPDAIANKKAHEISEATLRRLLPLLPELEAVEVELAFYERADFVNDRMFPEVGALSRKVMGMKSVTEEQREQIRAFRLQAARDRLAELKKERQQEGGDEDEGFDQAKYMAEMQAKSKAATLALDRLRATLTPEQIAEAGPPIGEITMYVPDFESNEEPPKQKAAPFADFGAAMQAAPQVNVLDMAYLSRMAGLSAEQKEAATDLVSGYESRFRLTMRKIKAFENSMRSSMMDGGMADPVMMKKGMRVMSTGHRYLTRIRTELMNDLRDLLTEDQLPKWPTFERRIARKSLSQAEMAYSGRAGIMDLPGMVEGAYADGAAPSDVVMEELESYEREMQSLVEVLLAVEAKQIEGMEKSLEADEFDLFKLSEVMEAEQAKIEEHRKQADEVRRRYIERLSGMMEVEPRMAFEVAVFSATMGSLRIFRMNDRTAPEGKELAGEIDRLKDLTEEQRARVSEISREKRAEIHAVHKELYEGYRSFEGGGQQDWNKMFEATRTEPMWSLFTRLNELNDSMVEELRAVLTPEQVGRLPKKWRQQEKVSYPRFDED